MEGIWVALEKHIQECKVHFQPYGWRIIEAIMYAMGSINKFVVRMYNERMLYDFPIVEYLTQWIQYANSCPVPITIARIMWVGGRYAALVDGPNAELYLKITTSNLINNSVILRYSAIRSFHWHFTTNKGYSFDILNRAEIAGLLVNAIKLSQGPILHIGLAALGELVSTAPIVALIQHDLIVMIRDFVGTSTVTPEIIFCSRAAIAQLYGDIETKENFENIMLPYLDTVYNNMKISIQDESTASGVCCRSMQIINSMILLSPLPINPRLVNIGFFGIYGYITFCEEDDVLLNGMECICDLLNKTSMELTGFSSRDGTTGQEVILAILRMILTYNKMNNSAKEIARFCIAVVRALNPLPASAIHFILQCALSILQLKLKNEVKENLFIIIGYLFHAHIDSVVTYLSLMPGPKGESGLHFVLNKWLSKISFIYAGRFQRNLAALSFARIIECVVLKKDHRLMEVYIAEEIVLQSGPHSKTPLVTMPVVFKLLKVLVNLFTLECSDMPEESPPRRIMFPHGHLLKTRRDSEQSGSDSDDSDDDFYVKQFDTCFLSEDPIYTLNLSEFIGKFFNSFGNDVIFCAWLNLLTIPEKATVRVFGINI